MNAAQQEHPSAALLLDFAHGRLSGAEFAEVEEHLHACDACCERMAQQPDNTLLVLAREVATLGAGHDRTFPTLSPGEVPAALGDHPRYRVLEQIGVGGMGSVYRAEHRLMQRTVALKIVHPWLLDSAQAVERFEREVRMAAKLTHPHIVVAHDADQADSLHFLVMEYVAGETLNQRIAREGPASVDQACEWIRQAAAGLEHAHQQGMAHRDIKPHNLMITPGGQLKILDFGLSRLVSDRGSQGIVEQTQSAGTSPTHAGMILGTPDYIAPEQIADSRKADIRSDIYSLGCTLYYLLTGQPPFVDDSIVGVLHAHAKNPFPRLDEQRTDIPERLQSILARMTAKRPEERYATPGEVERDLAVFLGSAPVEETLAPPVAPPPPPPPPPQAPRRPAPKVQRRSMLIGIGTALGLLVVLSLASAAYFASPLTSSRPVRLLVMLPSQGLWFPDYDALVKAADDAKVQLSFASVSEKPSQVLVQSPQGIAVPDLKLDARLQADDYDGIVFIGYESGEFLPGGAGGEDTARLVNAFQLQKKIVASLCAGQRILAQHGALRGKQVAPCQSVRLDEITVEGGQRSEHNVVTDGLVVTAADAQDAPEFLAAIRKLRKP